MLRKSPSSNSSQSISFITNESADSVPSWRDLIHFKNYINENFTDGSKWEDISKVIIKLTLHVLVHWFSILTDMCSCDAKRPRGIRQPWSTSLALHSRLRRTRCIGVV